MLLSISIAPTTVLSCALKILGVTCTAGVKNDRVLPSELLRSSHCVLPPRQEQVFIVQPHPETIIRDISVDCEELGLEARIPVTGSKLAPLAQLLQSAENRVKRERLKY